MNSCRRGEYAGMRGAGRKRPSGHLGHPVSARSSEVPIDDDDRHQNTNGVHDEGEQQILGDQRQHKGGRRQYFTYE